MCGTAHIDTRQAAPTSHWRMVAYPSSAVPQLSAFYGIVIRDGRVLDGGLPRSAHRLVRKWVRLHGRELGVAWELASMRRQPGTIPPLP
jgi:Domain of unknown function (DUF4160)